MGTADKRDERLRRLFSALPRLQAPPGFEERLLRRIARERRQPGFFRLRLGAYAVPALSLLLVGVLSYVIYTTRIRTGGGPLSAVSDTVSSVAPQSRPKPVPAPLPGSAPSSQLPAESAPGPVEEERAIPPPGRSEDFLPKGGVELKSPPDGMGRAAPSGAERGTTDMREFRRGIAPGMLTSPKSFFQYGRPELMNAGRTAPGRLMMGPALPDSAARADTAAAGDVPAGDSMHTPPDAPPDSLPDPDRRR